LPLAFVVVKYDYIRAEGEIMKREKITVTFIVALGLLAFAAGPVTADPLVISPGLSADALVMNLMGSGVTYLNAVYVGDASANGSFTGGTGIIGFDQGIILSSGSAAAAAGPNDSGGESTSFLGAGDTYLRALGGGVQTHDAAVLEFDFIPSASNLKFSFVFASEEYNEYVGSFNDIFGIFLNGVNVAIIPATSIPISIDNINNCVNPAYFINNNTLASSSTCPGVLPSAGLNTQFDGLTVVITLDIPVAPGVSHHFKFAIADALDYSLDSAVFIRSASFISGTPSFTPTITATWSETCTWTITETPTITPTITQTHTITETHTVSPTFTDTPTITCTSTITMTLTATVTVTMTPTPLPFCLALVGNFPNPFTHDTEIVYDLCRPSAVIVEIYTVSGEKVRTLNQDGVWGRNAIHWDGLNSRSKDAASGTYVYSIEAESRGEKDRAWGKCAALK
jgi:hypothetical protein